MGRVAVIGIDGFDPLLVSKWKDDLPNIAKLQEVGQSWVLDSIFPPDSVPAWTSIFTGLDPSEHNVLIALDFLDVARQKIKYDVSILRGKTYWDIAGKAGKKVCIVNPFAAYPAWPVNGTMVSGPIFDAVGSETSFPEEIIEMYSVPSLGAIGDIPNRRTLQDFYEKTRALTIEQAEFGLRLAKEREWDLFFICFLTLDRIQHYFWRYSDDGDPTYPGPGHFQDTVRDFYVLFDTLIGEFQASLGPRVSLMVHSDHGFGRRCTKTLNINEFLRREGYLQSKVKNENILDPKYAVERLKSRVLEAAFHHGFDEVLFKIVPLIPNRKKLKSSSYMVDSSSSLVHVPHFDGMNPSGGVEINQSELARQGIDFGEFRSKLIQAIKQIKDPDTHENIVEWVSCREDIYQGPYINKYPDVVFKMRNEYGISRAMHERSIVGVNPFHRKLSGGHRREGTLIINNASKPITANTASILNIGATILDLLDVPLDNRLRSQSMCAEQSSS